MASGTSRSGQSGSIEREMGAEVAQPSASTPILFHRSKPFDVEMRSSGCTRRTAFNFLVFEIMWAVLDHNVSLSFISYEDARRTGMVLSPNLFPKPIKIHINGREESVIFNYFLLELPIGCRHFGVNGTVKINVAVIPPEYGHVFFTFGKKLIDELLRRGYPLFPALCHRAGIHVNSRTVAHRTLLGPEPSRSSQLRAPSVLGTPSQGTRQILDRSTQLMSARRNQPSAGLNPVSSNYEHQAIFSDNQPAFSLQQQTPFSILTTFDQGGPVISEDTPSQALHQNPSYEQRPVHQPRNGPVQTQATEGDDLSWAPSGCWPGSGGPRTGYGHF